MNVCELYNILFDLYGFRGWWPVYCRGAGYHPGDYSIPQNEMQRYEICIGAILTQNTAWANVEKALFRLIEAGVLSPEKIAALDDVALAELIRPAGYFNVKAKKLRVFSEFYLALDGRVPSRAELLQVWGIGPETADSMLLYAYKQPSMVVDAYTRRIFANLAITDGELGYDELKALCETQLAPKVEVYQEFHALIVEHGKRYYSHCGKS